MEIYEKESTDGIRLSWNYVPMTKIAATRIVVPVGCLYTPMKEIENLGMVEYQAIECKQCSSVLNPFCQVDYRFKLWVCPFCMSRNNFPQHYAEHISEQNLPAELFPNYTTIEYVLPETTANQIFLFVIDTCILPDELSEVKDSIQQSLNLLPEEALVGLITYSRMIFVHEVGFTECGKCYAFNGADESNSQAVLDQLGVWSKSDPRGAQGGKGYKRFLMPILECEFTLNAILDDLMADPWDVPTAHRPLRATGAAIQVALALMEAADPIAAKRIILFMGGPCTIGNGEVVSDKLAEPIRSHLDIQKGSSNVKYMKKATKFYETIAQRATIEGIAIDLLYGSLDQAGCMEMRTLATMTGGYLVVSDSFINQIFKKSFVKIFEKGETSGTMELGYKSQIQVFTSKMVKICGAIGHCSSMQKKTASVADVTIGIGGTSQWRIGSIDKNTTLAFYFDVINSTQDFLANILRDKPPYVDPPTVSKENPIRFAVINDIHADPLYEPGRSSECGDIICCRKNNKMGRTEEKTAGPWGFVGGQCEVPMYVVEDLISRVLPENNIDFIMWLGDNSAHNVFTEGKKEHLDNTRHIGRLLKEQFGEMGQVYPVMGNHEPFPCDQYDMYSNKSQWILDELADVFRPWLTYESLQSFKKYGYYEQMHPGTNLRMVVMNTMVSDTLNSYIWTNITNVWNELDWLIRVLNKSEAQGTPVLLIGHQPPGSWTAEKEWTTRFEGIVDRYANIIRGQFYGHTEEDEFQLLESYITSTPAGVALSHPSVGTYASGNPSYRIYSMEREHFTLFDYDQYRLYLNMGKEGLFPIWKVAYTFTHFYAVPDMKNIRFKQIVHRMKVDKEFFKEMMIMHYKEGDKGLVMFKNKNAQQFWSCYYENSNFWAMHKCIDWKYSENKYLIFAALNYLMPDWKQALYQE